MTANLATSSRFANGTQGRVMFWNPACAAEKKKAGKMHDYTNSVSLYKSLPGWILEEDETESDNLKFLMQILIFLK